MPRSPRIAVVGSINFDLVAYCERLPRPGETLTAIRSGGGPGGKGANQAVAAALLGAEVRMIGRVGSDIFGRRVLDALGTYGIDTTGVHVDDGDTGTAQIVVDARGENQIVVSPGANARVSPGGLDVRDADAVLSQLEIPDEAVLAAAAQARFFCLNAAPARPVDLEPDLLVVNRLEHEVVGDRGRLVAVTLGAEGAILLERGKEVARARSPHVRAVDATAAGDAFTACLAVSLLEGRSREEALRRACVAGALAASRPGAQPSLPTAGEVDEILHGA